MATTVVKWEDEALKRFYRAFHKHGTGSWSKVAKDTKMGAGECEALAKQHMSFLSLASSQALETAFVTIVTDHFNVIQKKMKDEEDTEEKEVSPDKEKEEAGRSKAGGRRGGAAEAEEPEVQPPSSQKPRRTPKPTAAALAAEEEKAARRAAASNQATPKSAKKTATKPPPSPPAGDWNSSARKRSRKLFEDKEEQEGLPRYRSPVMDRWRGRHNTDVDEGVDALLSLASGAHAAKLEEALHGPEAGTTAEPEVDGAEAEPIQETPSKRGRGGRGVRATPTPTGTPVKGIARTPSTAAAAAAADAIPVPIATGLRSPRARVGLTTPGRGPPPSAGRGRKEPLLMSPTSSAQRGGASTAAVGAQSPDAEEDGDGVGAQSPEDGGEDGGGGGVSEDGGGGAEAPGPVTATGRPVRKRKPTAIALAAAAAADDDEGPGRGGRGGVVAAVAAAVAAAGATMADSGPSGVPMPELMPAAPTLPEAAGSASINGNDLLATEALLAKIAPVRTRGPARGSGPGSRRAAERAELASPVASLRPAAVAGEATAEGEEFVGGGGVAAEEEGGHPGFENGDVRGATPLRGGGRTNSGTASGQAAAAQQALMAQQELVAAATAQQLAEAEAAAAVAAPPPPRPPKPLPVRARRRKPLPERTPPMWEPVNVFPDRMAATGQGDAAGPGPSSDGGAAAEGAGLSVGPSGRTEPATTAAAGAPGGGMPSLEFSLRLALGPRLRRWCMYEFHYSALDRPWFMRNELMEFCMHMQLPTTQLTRLEWSVLRGALGRPRRLSLAFLREERMRLEGYREHARLKYDDVGLGMDVPHDLPRQLRVGQEVTARHPVSRQLHDGVILTVKGNKYRVQFHRSDLMTEVVRDTDVMPLDPHECMPVQLLTPPGSLNGRAYDPVRLATLRGGGGGGGGLQLPGLGGPLSLAGICGGPLGGLGGPFGMAGGMSGGMGSPMAGQMGGGGGGEGGGGPMGLGGGGGAGGARGMGGGGSVASRPLGSWVPGLENQLMGDADAAMVAEVQHALEVKEGLVARLAQLNHEAASGLHTDEGGGRTEHFQLQYTSVVLQLKETNAALEGALGRLQGRQQQVASAHSAGAVLALQQQQQQQQQQAAAAAAAVAGGMVRGPGGAGGGMPPAPLLPPLQSQQQHLHSVLQAPPSPGQGQGQGQQQDRPGSSSDKGGALGQQGGVPLVVPPPRGSGGTAAAAAGSSASAFAFSSLLGVPLSMLLAGTVAVSPEQLVEQALAEARTVVDACRGKAPSEPLGSAGPSAPVTAAATEAAAPAIIGGGGDGAVPLVLPPSGVLPATDGTAAAAVQVKTEGASPPPPGEAGNSASPLPPSALGEEELAESWLRDVIVGCVGVLFTVQHCTSGVLPAAAAAEALDLAVGQLRLRSDDAANAGLYAEIVNSVAGLRGHLTRALAA